MDHDIIRANEDKATTILATKSNLKLVPVMRAFFVCVSIRYGALAAKGVKSTKN